MKTSISFLKVSLVLSILFVVLFRSFVFQKNGQELSWDVLGYYLPLPSTFIHEDPLFNDFTWLKELNSDQDYAGTLFMVTQTPNGEPMYFFLLGMSFLYLPFFLFGHGIAYVQGYPMDGFSLPYEWTMVAGAITVTIIGLYFFSKILKTFFSDGISAIVLLGIVFGTNWSHHCTIKNLETVNYLFTLATITFWFTIQWHRTKKLKHLLGIVFGVVMAGLIKPSEVLILIFPVLYSVYNWRSAQKKFQLLFDHRIQILIGVLFGLTLCIPQLTYWHLKTGSLIFDSYQNNGVGLDFFSPHTMEALFSFRKGWLVYTPVMVFSLYGFPLMYNRNKQVFTAILVYFLVSFYIITSWTEWWYGAGFSNRPVIALYPFLAIPFGYLVEFAMKQKKVLSAALLILLTALSGLNLFQQWQQRSGLIHPTRMTKEYYWKVFLKTEKKKEWNELLLVHRDYGGNENFWDKENYKIVYEELIFDNDTILFNEFPVNSKIQFSSLTSEDHLWIEIRLRGKCATCESSPALYITNKMYFREKGYGWKGFPVKFSDSTFTTIVASRLTPNLRTREDVISTGIWNRFKNRININHMSIIYYERKPISERL